MQSLWNATDWRHIKEKPHKIHWDGIKINRDFEWKAIKILSDENAVEWKIWSRSLARILNALYAIGEVWAEKQNANPIRPN